MMAAVSMGTVPSSYLHFAREATAEIEHKPGEHIVDDKLAVRNVLTGLLQLLGYRVRECAGGADALQVLCCWPRTFDAVTFELSIPGMRGLDLAAMIHGLRPDLTLILGDGCGDAIGREKLTDRALRGLDSKACSMQGFGEALNRALMRSGALE
jgi:CheY-like chemotaxis protein